MSKILTIFGFWMMSVTLPSLSPLEAKAQSCNYFAGTAITGQKVNVDTCSMSRSGNQNVDFVYYLGNQKMVSQAHCRYGTWTTFRDRQTHRPQSQATQKMLDLVCSKGENI